ncbi:glutathione binding-like protein [Pelomicrobium methylotrophicum]|uniref:GST C-terminal domain-containing protein n=1 Tax=Pelomicrobium methylotrophicum TaxID=2602750 RepID=A0A5C7EEH4_9PROT|nr:glutathione binding-like protein [Pelomicrobium methylotrophicum]TXF10569.1 hypothetical protein FR698_14465 [Pelomicrobium methylotrophicum]
MKLYYSPGADYKTINPKLPEEAKAVLKSPLMSRIERVDRRLTGAAYAMGESFTVVHAYLFTVLGWGKYVGIDLSPRPVLTAYLGRVAARPAVQPALAVEGLTPASA